RGKPRALRLRLPARSCERCRRAGENYSGPTSRRDRPMNGSVGFLGSLDVRCGLGLLRLSTEGRPTEPDAIAVIHHALDRGIRLLDTAGRYLLAETSVSY